MQCRGYRFTIPYALRVYDGGVREKKVRSSCLTSRSSLLRSDIRTIAPRTSCAARTTAWGKVIARIKNKIFQAYFQNLSWLSGTTKSCWINHFIAIFQSWSKFSEMFPEKTICILFYEPHLFRCTRPKWLPPYLTPGESFQPRPKWLPPF